MTNESPIELLTMKKARRRFALQRKESPSFMTDGGFRRWARLSNLSGSGKLRRIVVGAVR